MVLQDLGRRINAAVSDLTRSPSLDEKVRPRSPTRTKTSCSQDQAFDGMIKEICTALVEADVNIKLVSSLRNSIKRTVNFSQQPPGVNKKRLIQKVWGTCILGSSTLTDCPFERLFSMNL